VRLNCGHMISLSCCGFARLSQYRALDLKPARALSAKAGIQPWGHDEAGPAGKRDGNGATQLLLKRSWRPPDARMKRALESLVLMGSVVAPSPLVGEGRGGGFTGHLKGLFFKWIQRLIPLPNPPPQGGDPLRPIKLTDARD
jgi:hypothetical protein